MTFYIYSPDWFLGIDSLLEIFTIFISLILGVYSYKIYNTFKLKKYKFFSIAFMLLALTFILKIISNLIFIITEKEKIGSAIYTVYESLSFVDEISFLLHKITLILALIILFLIINKESKFSTIVTLILLGILVSILANTYVVFNFIVILLLLSLFLINYFQNDKSKKKGVMSNLSKFF